MDSGRPAVLEKENERYLLGDDIVKRRNVGRRMSE